MIKVELTLNPLHVVYLHADAGRVSQVTSFY